MVTTVTCEQEASQASAGMYWNIIGKYAGVMVRAEMSWKHKARYFLISLGQMFSVGGLLSLPSPQLETFGNV